MRDNFKEKYRCEYDDHTASGYGEESFARQTVLGCVVFFVIRNFLKRLKIFT